MGLEMSDRRKFVVNAALALATLFLTAVLWHYPVALIALLLVTAVAIYRIRPDATSIVVYATAFVFGPLAEAVSITTGAWAYDSPQLLGIPIWLPFVWGNAGLFILNTAELWKSLLAPMATRVRTSSTPVERGVDTAVTAPSANGADRTPTAARPR